MKEKIFCVWTNQVSYFGNTKTNIVEFTHATLKNSLENSKGDLCKGWESMNQMIKNQNNEIQT